MLTERDAGRLSKHRHHDTFGNPCCFWRYPDELIVCDEQNQARCTDPQSGRRPPIWLPSLAFTSKTFMGEVLVHMLKEYGPVHSQVHRRRRGFQDLVVDESDARVSTQRRWHRGNQMAQVPAYAPFQRRTRYPVRIKPQRGASGV